MLRQTAIRRGAALSAGAVALLVLSACATGQRDRFGVPMYVSEPAPPIGTALTRARADGWTCTPDSMLNYRCERVTSANEWIGDRYAAAVSLERETIVGNAATPGYRWRCAARGDDPATCAETPPNGDAAARRLGDLSTASDAQIEDYMKQRRVWRAKTDCPKDALLWPEFSAQARARLPGWDESCRAI